jgi:hypothetical protein
MSFSEPFCCGQAIIKREDATLVHANQLCSFPGSVQARLGGNQEPGAAILELICKLTWDIGRVCAGEDTTGHYSADNDNRKVYRVAREEKDAITLLEAIGNQASGEPLTP